MAKARAKVVETPVEFARDIFGGLRLTVRSGKEVSSLYIPRDLLIQFYRESDFWRNDEEISKALELFPETGIVTDHRSFFGLDKEGL